MGAVKRTLVEVLIVGGLACALAFGTNALRTSGAIEIGKDYFYKGDPKSNRRGSQNPTQDQSAPNETAPRVETEAQGSPGGRTTSATLDHLRSEMQESPSRATQGDDSLRVNPASLELPKNETSVPDDPGEGGDEDAHIDHDYQDIHTDEVIEWFHDPLTKHGVNLFIDARDDDAFAEGHIPGAQHVYAYEVARYLTEDLLTRINEAQKVVVYCGGGNCEDSIFLCRDLIDEFNVSYDKVYLYAGGWKAWTKRGMPVESGQ